MHGDATTSIREVTLDHEKKSSTGEEVMHKMGAHSGGISRGNLGHGGIAWQDMVTESDQETSIAVAYACLILYRCRYNVRSNIISQHSVITHPLHSASAQFLLEIMRYPLEIAPQEYRYHNCHDR